MQRLLSYSNASIPYVLQALLVSVLYLSTGVKSYSQQKIYGKILEEDKVLYHGNILSYDAGEKVIMDCQEDTLTFDLSKYDFIFTTRRAPKKYKFPDGTWYNRFEVGTLSSEFSSGAFVRYGCHQQVKRLLGLGASLGYENHGNEDGYEFAVLSVDYYGFLSPTNKSLYINGSAGYGLALRNTGKGQTEASGGLNAGLRGGYRFSTNRMMVDVGLGWRTQQGNYVFEEVDPVSGAFTKISDIRFNKLELSLGLMW